MKTPIRSSNLSCPWLCCLTLLLANTAAFAQDTLFLHNGRALAVQVQEIGLDEIKFIDPASELKVVMVMEKNEVARVKMAGGKEIRFLQDPFSAGFSAKALGKTHVIKMDMLAPAFGHVVFGYEQVIKPWMNFEAKVGVIGVGFGDAADENEGYMAKAGLKFLSRPENLARGTKSGHPLHGRYMKPEIIFSSFTQTFQFSSFDPGGHTNATMRYNNVAFNMVLGTQRFLGQGITLDTFVGLGFGTQWIAGAKSSGSVYGMENYAFSHTLLGKQLPLAVSAGMTLGVAF